VSFIALFLLLYFSSIIFFFLIFREEEWQTVSKVPAKVAQVPSSGIRGNKCYLIFSVDGKLQSRVVIQSEPSIAPIMSAKFKEMCCSSTGYIGSRIFKVTLQLT